MSLAKGDHLVIKRDGKILTPDCGEAYHEFEVAETPVYEGVDGGPGYIIKAKVIH